MFYVCRVFVTFQFASILYPESLETPYSSALPKFLSIFSLLHFNLRPLQRQVMRRMGTASIANFIRVKLEYLKGGTAVPAGRDCSTCGETLQYLPKGSAVFDRRYPHIVQVVGPDIKEVLSFPTVMLFVIVKGNLSLRAFSCGGDDKRIFICFR